VLFIIRCQRSIWKHNGSGVTKTNHSESFATVTGSKIELAVFLRGLPAPFFPASVGVIHELKTSAGQPATETGLCNISITVCNCLYACKISSIKPQPFCRYERLPCYKIMSRDSALTPMTHFCIVFVRAPGCAILYIFNVFVSTTSDLLTLARYRCIVTLGKLFTPNLPLSQSSLIWFWHKGWGVNTHHGLAV